MVSFNTKVRRTGRAYVGDWEIPLWRNSRNHKLACGKEQGDWKIADNKNFMAMPSNIFRQKVLKPC